MKSLLKLADEYKFQCFLEAREDVAVQMIAACLYSLYLKGYRKKRIQKAYDDILAVLNMPSICGKELEGTEVMKMLEEKCGIDFTKVNVKTESEREFQRRNRK